MPNRRRCPPIAPRSDEEKEKQKEEKKDAAAPVVKITVEGLSNRILAVDIPARNYSALYNGPEGFIFYAEIVANQQGLTLSRYNFKDRKGEVFLSPVNDVAISNDRKSILYRSNAVWGILGTSDSNKKIGDDDIFQM